MASAGTGLWKSAKGYGIEGIFGRSLSPSFYDDF